MVTMREPRQLVTGNNKGGPDVERYEWFVTLSKWGEAPKERP
jgi:hypothetical protein